MIVKKFIIAVILALVTLAGVYYLWHIVLFKEMYAELLKDIGRPEFCYKFAIASGVIQALILSIVYRIGYNDGSPIAEGVKFGLLMGLLLCGQYLFINYAVLNIASWQWMLMEGLYLVIATIVAGLLIGVSYGVDSGD